MERSGRVHLLSWLSRRVLLRILQRLGILLPVSGNPAADPSSTGFRIESTLFPGDANGDGTVDINDLTIVLSNFGKTGMAWSQGEFTGSGTVDINDLTIVLATSERFRRGPRRRAGALRTCADRSRCR